MLIRNLISNDYEEYIKLLDTNITKEYFNNFINNVLNNNHIILVLENNNDIIGSATLLIEKKLTYGGCNLGHIENIFINKDCRGKGYGKKLVNQLLEYAKENMCYRVDLNCNEELQEFYKKHNFTKEQICMNIYFKDNFQ